MTDSLNVSTYVSKAAEKAATSVAPKPRNLIARLRDPSDGWSGDALCVDAEAAALAADRIEELETQNGKLRAGLFGSHANLPNPDGELMASLGPKGRPIL